jgi:acetylornithine deacetylase/succinyl-diaminopimelate desuccinylase-like protein
MRALLAGAALAASLPAAAQTTAGGREALEVLQRAVAFRTVAGGDEVPKLAAYLQDHLAKAGFAPADMRFVPHDKTGYLIVRYRGTDRAAKPIVLIDHMDVVEARRSDWARDPFVPVVEGGYVYGRGVLDDKSGVAIAVATLAGLKRNGWVPKRDVVLALSGDEETDMATTERMAAELKDADVVLNGDAGGGTLGPDGKPTVFALSAAEKTYADFTLTVTDPGGHSSRPGATNAIARLARAIGRIDAHRFAVEQNPITRAYFAATARTTAGALGTAMAAFAANRNDAAAIATLSAEPETVGQIRTTCVPTLLEGGHAPNALPQKATANVNCRIFPGTSADSVLTILTRVIDDTGVTIGGRDATINEAPASPLRADVMQVVTAAVQARVPGLTVVPAMESGATDSTHFRKLGIPAYGVSGVFIKDDDVRAHGLDERLPLATLDGGVAQMTAIVRALASR